MMAATGCSSKDTGAREAPVPKYDPDGIAKAAMAEFDKNNDGVLDPAELRVCPALYLAIAEIDTNGDKKLSADEIRKRVEVYAASPTGSIPVTCMVRLDNRALTGAAVTFDPEQCMGQSLKQATGTTDNEGQCAEYEIDGKTYRGLAAGLYRIRVTKDGVSIPARFNSQTTLGREIVHNARTAMVWVEIDLSSK
jgi:hypothetical protein